MARVTHVTRARGAYTCEKCGTAIPKGSPYIHATPGFRGRKKIRCTDPKCSFRTSDLCTSNMQTAYLAQEAFEDSIGECLTLDDVKQCLQDYADGLNECAEMYEEASSNWAGGSNEEWDEKVSMLQDAASELENFDWDPEEGDTVEADDEDEDEEGDGIEDEPVLSEAGIANLRAAAEEHAGNVSFE